MDSDNDVALQFIAQLINEGVSSKVGYTAVVRWWCLRDELKEKYLEEARSMVTAWHAKEDEELRWAEGIEAGARNG